MELIKLNPKERIRIYHLKDGGIIELKGITHFLSTDTSHRVKDELGTLYIIPKDVFNYIEIHAENFTL